MAVNVDSRKIAKAAAARKGGVDRNGHKPLPPEGGDPAKVNILMVDDTPENLVALEAILVDLNQNLVKARSGEAALRLLLQQDFAVILLDVNMPGMNGFDTAAMIRQRKNTEHTPIIFVTANSTSEMHMFKGYSLGAVDYIFTPILPDVLRTKVGVFVELLRKNEETKRQGEQLRKLEEAEHLGRLNETRERLEFETNRNRFFTLSIEMLAIAGFDGYFRQLNPTWEKILGFKEEQLKQQRFLDLVHPDDLASVGELLGRIMQSEVSAYFETRYRCSDSSYRWLAWTAAPFLAEKLLYLFARDITARKEAEAKIQILNIDLESRARQLQEANRDLEAEIGVRKQTEVALQQSNEELESFSYSVSHDLRAPLRAMQGFAKILLEDYSACLDETGRDCAERIVSATCRMDQLIHDLLLYSQLGHHELEVEPIDFSAILNDAKTQLASELSDRQAVVELDGSLPIVMGHDSTLTQVLCNLISNGIKFVPPGRKPVVRIWGETAGENGRIWVCDNGIGIAKSDQARVFRVFERLHGADVYPGTGIGLAIVRKGIERMKGHVGLESEVGEGTRFWIELPLAPARVG